MLLDRSGSMNWLEDNDKTRWENLIDSMSKFLTLLESNDNLKMNSRVTIIGHCDTSDIEC
jgi:hypothetical protein